MKFTPIIVDNNNQEIREHADISFPLSMDLQSVQNSQCHSIQHWHKDIQISVVLTGKVQFRINNADYLLTEGQGIFINSSCLHEIVLNEETRDGVYLCANFDPAMLSGLNTSMVSRDYIEPIIQANELQMILLVEDGWQRKVCETVVEMGSIDKGHAFGYEILLLNKLIEIWYHIVINNQEIIDTYSKVDFYDKTRMKKMQKYIQNHYMYKITLQDIADSAHISQGECCRVFTRVLHTSPIQYLIHYRITQSLKFLKSTDLNIAEIALQTGFGSSSHFTESFKKEMKMTPFEYRHRNPAQ